MIELDEDCFISFELDDNDIPVDIIQAHIIASIKDTVKITFHKNKTNDYSLIHKKDFTIFGQTVNSNKKFTLKNCYVSSFPGMQIASNHLILSKTKIQTTELYLGEWLKDEYLNKINKVKIRFSYLEYWLDSFIIKNEFSDNYNDIEITNLLPEYQKININNLFSFNIITYYNTNIEKNKKHTIDTTKYIELEFNEYVNIEIITKYIVVFHNFFKVILPSTKVFKEQILLHIEDNNKDIEMLDIQSNYVKENDKITRFNFLYRYEINTIEDILSTWFKLNDKYKFLFDILGTLLDKNTYIYEENKFLAYMQWIEGYCRVEYPTTKEDIDIFQNKINNILNQLSNIKDKNLILEMNKYKYEKSLVNQMQRLLIDNEIDKILNSKRKIKSLSNNLVKYRNNITHQSDIKNYKLITIAYLNNFLKNLIYLILINKLSISKENNIKYDEISSGIINYQKNKD